jgi:NADPH:quinone reductase-like Zn-dependent oxidoreductase
MKAIVCNTYGELELQEIAKPELTDDGVLVRVHASSVNPADRYSTLGTPLLMRPTTGMRKPRSNRVGTDFAGTVEAVGKDVTEFRPGDEVFGGRTGSYAEYVVVPQDRAIVPKPANVTFEQAGAVGAAGLTALQGLRDKGRVQPGQKILVNGASGGVGTFAVQIAKALGAEVTAVCSTRNVDTARSLGADDVVDYTQEDFTRSDRRYDLIFDVAGSRSWSECRRVLNPQATLIMVGAPKGGRVLGPMSHLAGVRLASAVRGSQKAVFFIAQFNKADMQALRELLETGKVTPVIDRRYGLSDVADGFGYLGEGHAQGKIVITV